MGIGVGVDKDSGWYGGHASVLHQWLANHSVRRDNRPKIKIIVPIVNERTGKEVGVYEGFLGSQDYANFLAHASMSEQVEDVVMRAGLTIDDVVLGNHIKIQCLGHYPNQDLKPGTDLIQSCEGCRYYK